MIQLRAVTKKYKNKYALKNVNLDIGNGEFVFLVGKSGAGKSTLMKILYKEETPSSGTVIIGGLNIANITSDKVPNLRRCMGIVFQDYKLLPKQTVYDNVAYVIKTLGISSKEVHKRVTGALKVVGLIDKMKAKPTELSGGEQQRVSIARAIVNGPPLLIADEPTGNLDRQNAINVLDMMLELKNELGTALVVVTHDDQLAQRFERVLLMNDGQLQAA